jgi:hypothetical protein
MKLLAPTENAPRERVPQPAAEAPWDELSAPEQFDAAAPQERPDVTVTPKETEPLWQDAEKGALEARAEAGAASPAPVPPRAGAEETPLPPKRESSKSRKKPTIRSLTRGERTGNGRQKLMTAMIPVLVILIVVVLRHPLGARPAVKAASARPRETARPVITDVQIAWEIPSPYEPGGRDPMKGTRSPVVTVDNTGTAVVPAAPVVELVVTGILYSKDNPAAIVDTQVVHEGQQISGATVEKIEKDGIQFERNGRRWKQTVSQ